MLVETYLRRGKRHLERMLLDPKVRSVLSGAVWGGGGYLLSAAGLGDAPLPAALGAICSARSWQAVLMTLGAMTGYVAFWGSAGLPGLVWSAAGGLLAVLVGSREESRQQPLMIPAIAAFLTAVTELVFWFFLGDKTPLPVRIVRVMLTFACGVLFTQASRCRDPITDWLCGGVAALALARVELGPVRLGYVFSGMLSAAGAFPAAALAGLGLDLARVTVLPMTAGACLAYFLRMVPWDRRWQSFAMPAVALAIVSAALGSWDRGALAGVALGGALGVVLPAQPAFARRRGQTGAAQVRLELSARIMVTLRQTLSEAQSPPIDREALFQKAVRRACGNCPVRKSCHAVLSPALLEDPLEADCRRQERLVEQLRQSREQLRLLKADRKRRQEYRLALEQQYGFLERYLKTLADSLPRGVPERRAAFRVEASARSRSRQRANGDRCLAFPGTECCFFILLCDGMGTGLGAAQEGQQAANLLRQLLTAGFPAEHSLSTVNAMLALRGCAGGVTMDLAQIHLDSGVAEVYKWGAAPSYVLGRRGAEKIGTATAPPGVTVGADRPVREKLSLRRGEVLILLSDGVDGEESFRRFDLSPDAPPGELAARILEMGGSGGEDDATAAAIRLRPVSLGVS